MRCPMAVMSNVSVHMSMSNGHIGEAVHVPSLPLGW